jgi:putative transposase
VFQALIDAEATARIGAGPHQPTPARVTHRNGHRDRLLATAAGDLELRIPKLRSGSFFPSLLERRRRIDQALFAVVMEAYVTGTSTRKVEDLVEALGADSGISRSEVSRICAGLDAEITAFRDRPLSDAVFPYVFLDATFCKARVGGDRRGRGSRVAAQALVIAIGISAGGRREVLGFDVGDSESGAFWAGFMRSLRTRGLSGVQLVTSDAHTGLKAAIETTLLGASWQRCRIHAQRNLLAAVPKDHADMVAAAVRTIFAQPDAASVRSQLDVIAGMLGRQFPKVEATLRDARDELPPSPTFQPSTGRRSGAPTGWNESTRKSSAGPTLSARSPTPPRCSASPAPSSPRSTTNGKSATGASCPRHPSPSSSNPRPTKPPTLRLPCPPRSRHSSTSTRHPR